MPASIHIRPAISTDLPEIVRMLTDDDLGRQRELYELPLPDSYISAFNQMAGSPFFELVVAELDGHIVGTLQLIFIPSISYQGGLRAQVESVRVDRPMRNQGIGKQMMEWAVERSRNVGAHVLQLTTHNSRTNAHRFYEQLGFTSTHLGMKLSLK